MKYLLFVVLVLASFSAYAVPANVQYLCAKYIEATTDLQDGVDARYALINANFGDCLMHNGGYNTDNVCGDPNKEAQAIHDVQIHDLKIILIKYNKKILAASHGKYWLDSACK